MTRGRPLQIGMMPIPARSRGRTDALEAGRRKPGIEATRTHGAREARRFRLATGRGYGRQRALDWLRTAIDSGRAELQSQQAPEREIEAWDMSCRIAFMLAVV
jgi:hypothetical protein